MDRQEERDRLLAPYIDAARACGLIRAGETVRTLPAAGGTEPHYIYPLRHECPVGSRRVWTVGMVRSHYSEPPATRTTAYVYIGRCTGCGVVYVSVVTLP